MRMIDADVLKANVPNTNVDIFENCRNCSTLMDWQVKELIDEQPTVDAVKVKHGDWLNEEDGYSWYGKCSVCGESWNIDAYYAGNMNYCPNCGAKMDGKENRNELYLETLENHM